MEISMQVVTMFGAIIAAVAAFTNLWLTYFDRRDAIYVRYGQHTPIATPAAGLYVVNTGKHPVYISDFGFIGSDGKLFSIPWYHESMAMHDGDDSNSYYVGTTTIAPHDFFSIGLTYKPEIIGVYAITSTQNIRRVSMRRSRLWPKVFFKYLYAKFWARYY